jgi:hypothetical protein
MTEIYSYDITTHERFARDQKEVEAFQRQFHLPRGGAGLIAIQTKVLDFIPKHPAVVLLLQIYQRKTWARFSIPKNYHNQRFLSSYVAPSLGPAEKQDADIHRIESYLKQKTKKRDQRKEKQEQRDQQNNEEDQLEDEGQVIIQLLSKGVKETNQMVDFVIARMHQFVQA